MAGIHDLARPLRDPADLDPLLERIGDAPVVAIGEASHGTHEYYAWRAALTRRLVTERGFGLVAVEGDWPDCYRVNRSVKLRPGADADPRDALDAFSRWPTWMWANDDLVDFCRWLRDVNAERVEGERVGFYGLDVYSLWDSVHELVGWLRDNEPEHVDTAVRALRCFEPFGEDGAEYAFASRFAPTSCEQAAVELLHSLCEGRGRAEAGTDPEARFSAEQNAAVVVDAERYYRAMVQGSAESWNVRDVHMVDTVDRLLAHPESGTHPAKAVVWEHNTHIGDARATDMADAGMTNVGQLLRERHGTDGVVLIGFGGYRGGVIAGSGWGAQMQRMPVPEARSGSLEALLHEELGRDALLVWDRDGARPAELDRRLDHRAIGVVYRPEREKWGNYVPTVLGERYDAFLYLEDTSPLQPLHLERADEHVPPLAHAV
ncbi:erythromycin esterase family protein [Geodermatophilus poikilotrophus]|uniref:Erythromycin esterase homolog n=1 Tax=Geodermatophilus poikilotrophus TaxID=1333667 RepID=A0A1I0CJX8_9ACTN|nr:erythromycin esterase family protein [Geodermatophilus poikilotrophus]SET19285.1 Erythromycin esterase homolog [Geodermatophilus poikilotrophus]